MSRTLGTLVVLFAVGAACADGGPEDGGAGSRDEGPAWVQIPPSPLTPRYGAHAFWVGDRVVVAGGFASDPCPPGADCALPSEPPLRDGAALDPATGHWRSIAEAPVPLGWVSGAVLGSRVYLWVEESGVGSSRAFLAYHAEADRWEELPAPPVGGDHGYVLAAGGDRIVAYQGTQESGVRSDLAYDTASGTWSEVPADPLIPSFDRTMVWTDAGLVLIGIENVPQPGSEGPALYRAAVLDLESRSWRRLADSEVTGYDPSWFWSGGFVVNPTLGTSDGGGVGSWGRAYPHGGILDPIRGAWLPLPDPPPPGEPFPFVATGGGEYVASFSGWALHVPTGTWLELPPPPGVAHEGPAIAWAGDGLFVWGGVRWNGAEPKLLSDGWLWEPSSTSTPSSA
ncbi:MAG: hypothetical protein ACRDHU_01735 [Actinomycetota bacterium]